MGQLRTIEVCMAPSVVLTRLESSTMGNIAEQTVLRDYLRDTSTPPPGPFERPLPTKTHWWDTGNQHAYRLILLERHAAFVPGREARLRKLNGSKNLLRKLKVPDIS